MGKIAFVFSGQGDQYPGMGKELCEKYPIAAEVFHMCEVLRPGTMRQCFEGPADELKETKNTQPCLFAMELAVAEVLMGKGIMPHAVAGFSLGEVAAATVAGIFDRETGFRLVSKRGELMQTEAEKHDTAMAAVVRLTAQQVCELTAKYDGLYPVNFNCPGNITVSGLAEQMGAFSADVKAAGGRALPMKVKGAFHAVYSVISPEGCASILWKDAKKAEAAAASLKLTAPDALGFGVIERIIPEKDIGSKPFYDRLRRELEMELNALSEDPGLIRKRYDRFRKLGVTK